MRLLKTIFGFHARRGGEEVKRIDPHAKSRRETRTRPSLRFPTFSFLKEPREPREYIYTRVKLIQMKNASRRMDGGTKYTQRKRYDVYARYLRLSGRRPTRSRRGAADLQDDERCPEDTAGAELHIGEGGGLCREERGESSKDSKLPSRARARATAHSTFFSLRNEPFLRSFGRKRELARLTQFHPRGEINVFRFNAEL